MFSVKRENAQLPIVLTFSWLSFDIARVLCGLRVPRARVACWGRGSVLVRDGDHARVARLGLLCRCGAGTPASPTRFQDA